MRRFIFILVLMIGVVALAQAQQGLAINNLFQGAYSSDPRVTETFMTGSSKFLKRNKLKVLASFKGPASVYAKEVEKLVLKDGLKAFGKNVRYKEGKLNFACYMLPPIIEGAEKINKYIYFVNTSLGKGSDVMVVYLEGKIKEDEIGDFIWNMGKKSK